MKSFSESLNEGKVQFDKMTFTVSYVNDGRNFGVQFIPDGKTLDNFSKNTMVESILSKLKEKMPDLGNILVYQINNHAAGLTFSIDPYELTKMIEKQIK